MKKTYKNLMKSQERFKFQLICRALITIAGKEIDKEDDFSIDVSTYLYKDMLKMLSIYTDINWNFTLLPIFFNEMWDFIQKDHCVERLQD